MRYYRGTWAPGVIFCRSGNGKMEKQAAEGELTAVSSIPEGTERLCWLFERNPADCRGSFALNQEPEVAILQMAQKEEGVFWLNRRTLRDKVLRGGTASGEIAGFGDGLESDLGVGTGVKTGKEPGTENLDAVFLDYVKKGLVRAVNLAHPCWKNAALWKPAPGKKRVHILAMGDVGSMLLTGLKLLGADVIETIGIWDINEAAAAYWACEMNQAMYPWDYERMPEVEVIKKEQLFDCDVFLFCASRGVPPVGAAVSDVRMVQFEANAAIVREYGKMAREKNFQGLFGVVSDPVDPLCKAAYLESNRDETGRFDGRGLLPEQIQGFGLGVMNARAAYFAKRDSRFASFLREGRAYGPHGEDLVIANSLKLYDDQLSRELTHLAVTANLKVRELGFKPYVAPALSSGALSVLLMLRGAWHYSSTFLGGVFMGAKNRFTPMGLETECEEIPETLFERIKQAADGLKKIL